MASCLAANSGYLKAKLRDLLKAIQMVSCLAVNSGYLKVTSTVLQKDEMSDLPSDSLLGSLWEIWLVPAKYSEVVSYELG